MSKRHEWFSHEQRSERELSKHLAVYSKDRLSAELQSLVAARVATALRGMDARVERVVVRFEDLNGPKGGDDTSCRIQVSVSGRPAIVVEAVARGEGRAFRLALPRLTTAFCRERERARTRPHITLREMQPSSAS
jgi:hypothetical protein